MTMRGSHRWLALAATAALAACSSAEGPVPPAATGSASPPATDPPPASPAPDTGLPNAADPSALAGDTWTCGRLTVLATDTGDQVALRWEARDLTLPAVPSANGNRYADAAGNEFWSRGDEAMFTLAGEPAPRDCVLAGAGPAAATATGDFRAVGQEPGWFAELTVGARHQLHVEADYGEIVIDVAGVRADATGWTGLGPEDVPVSLTFLREACADAMSGRDYEARATLTIGDRQWTGCGEFTD